MGDPAGQPAYGFHLLGLAQLYLQLMPLGDVHDCSLGDISAFFIFDQHHVLNRPDQAAILVPVADLKVFHLPRLAKLGDPGIALFSAAHIKD